MHIHPSPYEQIQLAPAIEAPALPLSHSRNRQMNPRGLLPCQGTFTFNDGFGVSFGCQYRPTCSLNWAESNRTKGLDAGPDFCNT